MASATAARDWIRLIVGTWNRGVGAGIAGVIPMILFNHLWLGKELFPLFGIIPFAVLWGVLYAGIATLDRIKQVATAPRTGIILGIIYGFLVWWGPQVGKPMKEYLTVNGAIQVVFFGVVLGLVYAYSPDVE